MFKASVVLKILQVADELKKHEVALFLANCNAGVRSKFPSNSADSKIDQARNIFPTLHDAVLAAADRQNKLSVGSPAFNVSGKLRQ